MDASAGQNGLLHLSTSRCGDSATVMVAGELDLATAGQLRSYAMEVLRGGGRQFVLEMTGVRFIDASGLGTLVALAAQAADRGIAFLLGEVSPAVARVLKITGLTQVFPTLPA